jgi:hypothetical protein
VIVRPADSLTHRPEISRDGHKKATNLGGAVLYASPHKGGRSHNGTGQVIGRHTVIAARLPSGLRPPEWGDKDVGPLGLK